MKSNKHLTTEANIRGYLARIAQPLEFAPAVTSGKYPLGAFAVLHSYEQLPVGVRCKVRPVGEEGKKPAAGCHVTRPHPPGGVDVAQAGPTEVMSPREQSLVARERHLAEREADLQERIWEDLKAQRQEQARTQQLQRDAAGTLATLQGTLAQQATTLAAMEQVLAQKEEQIDALTTQLAAEREKSGMSAAIARVGDELANLLRERHIRSIEDMPVEMRADLLAFYSHRARTRFLQSLTGEPAKLARTVAELSEAQRVEFYSILRQYEGVDGDGEAPSE